MRVYKTGASYIGVDYYKSAKLGFYCDCWKVLSTRRIWKKVRRLVFKFRKRVRAIYSGVEYTAPRSIYYIILCVRRIVSEGSTRSKDFGPKLTVVFLYFNLTDKTKNTHNYIRSGIIYINNIYMFIRQTQKHI